MIYADLASAECLEVCGEVTGFALDTSGLMQVHQLSVDAYGAQHGGGGTPPIRLAFSLVGLYLALDRDLDGEQVRAAHARMGKPDASWPAFTPPDHLGLATIMSVAEQGLMRGSRSGHLDAVTRWAEAVWTGWARQRKDVIALAGRLLPDLGRVEGYRATQAGTLDRPGQWLCPSVPGNVELTAPTPPDHQSRGRFAASAFSPAEPTGA